jgi:hypothetical protein
MPRTLSLTKVVANWSSIYKEQILFIEKTFYGKDLQDASHYVGYRDNSCRGRALAVSVSPVVVGLFPSILGLFASILVLFSDTEDVADEPRLCPLHRRCI